ncbi:diphosphomevalonate decarboxylase [Bombilactobacillus bombi]|uniref:diphosphomevalonate decarboxylase n=1 Tax=Bombilactobacillus bombi TaxID=1303590 RepID=UPI0015E5DB2F|nr:diphosphomevalonate decarboxylase [Bombilactobacillus bombi]
MTTTTTTAHTNIALIKYWGKKDEHLHLPYTDSLSLTLDGYYSVTTTSFIQAPNDQIFINHHPASPEFFSRTEKFLNLIRKINHSSQKIEVKTDNFVPTAAGLASSASGFAALAGSLAKLFQMSLTKTELSALARLGSGSATRSIFGGFVQWHQGHNSQTSIAEPILEKPTFPIRLLSVVINNQAKKISSTTGMQQAVATSPFYPQWPHIVQQDLQHILKAIKNQDLEQIGAIAEANCLAMHALNWSARPAFSYFEDTTYQVIEAVKKLRQRGYLAYYTIDAGPNVKIITTSKDLLPIKEYLQTNFPQAQMTALKPGPGLQ